MSFVTWVCRMRQRPHPRSQWRDRDDNSWSGQTHLAWIFPCYHLKLLWVTWVRNFIWLLNCILQLRALTLCYLKRQRLPSEKQPSMCLPRKACGTISQGSCKTLESPTKQYIQEKNIRDDLGLDEDILSGHPPGNRYILCAAWWKREKGKTQCPGWKFENYPNETRMSSLPTLQYQRNVPQRQHVINETDS